MKKTYRTYGFFLISILLTIVLSCDKSKSGEPFNSSINNNRTIKIEVKHLYNDSLLLDSLVENAIIKIYDNRDDFIYDVFPEATTVTDSSGLASFEYRTQNYYWIRAQHDSLGTIIDSVSTPPNTISFVYLKFY